MSRIIVPVLALILGGAIVLFFPVTQPQRVSRTLDQRVKEGPHITTTKALSPTEDLSLVVIPSEFGEPLDIKCFVYKNREFGQVTFLCPDARQEEISVPENR